MNEFINLDTAILCKKFTMPKHLQQILLLLVPIFLVSCRVEPSSNRHHQHGLKSLHFSLFQHETINKTGYVIVNGVTGPGITQTTTPFGTLFAFQDPMTIRANTTSKKIGISEGTSITTGLDGLQSISIAKITLNMKKHKGSVSVLGVTNNIKPSTHPIVGGTGDFLFAQGYLTSSPVNLVGQTVTYKIEFHIYWPQYIQT